MTTPDILDELSIRSDSTSKRAHDEIERLRAERDSWKHCANEYAERLQPLIMDVLYKHCEPLSHKWPGKRHVDCIGEAVEFILSRLADAEKVVEAAREADAAYATYRDDKMRPHPDDAHEVRRWTAMNTLREALAAYREKHKEPTP